MLRALRTVLRRHGRLSAELIDRTSAAPSITSLIRRFGSLSAAYAEIGYPPPGSEAHRDRVRQDLLVQLRAAYDRQGYLSWSQIDADPNLPCAGVYRRQFGSLRRAYELAGLPFTDAQLKSASRERWMARRAAGKARGRAKLDDAAVLAALRRMHAERGFVSIAGLKADPAYPSPDLLRYRFGSVLAAYARAGPLRPEGAAAGRRAPTPAQVVAQAAGPGTMSDERSADWGSAIFAHVL